MARFGEHARDAAADGDDGVQRSGRQFFDLAVPGVEFLEELLHGRDAGRNDWLRRALGAGFADQALQHRHGGENLALDALLDDGEEERPDVGGSAEVVTAIADAAVDLDKVPVLQFTEANADVGSRDGERLGDLLGGKGLGREVEQGMDLGDGTVDAPSGAHFPPVEDEFLHGVGEFHVTSISEISVTTEISENGIVR